MDTLSITNYPFNLVLLSLLFCLPPLRTTSFPVNNNKKPTITMFRDESKKKKQKKKIVAPAAGPAGSRFKDRLDRRRCRGLFTSAAARIERAEPSKQRSAAKLLQGECRSRSRLTMRCNAMDDAPQRETKQPRKTRGRAS